VSASGVFDSFADFEADLGAQRIGNI